MSWWVSTQITILNMPFHMKSVQKILNMEMNLWELATHLINMSKDCQRICSDFIFTVVCSDLQGNLSLDCDGSGSAECNQHWQSKTR